MTRVKICGLTRSEDAHAAVEAGAAALGFIFWSGSPRVVTPEVAAAAGPIGGGVARVGVFVNARPDVVRQIVTTARLTAIQLHGDERPADYSDCGVPIIKAVALASEDDLERARRVRRDVTLLVDAHDARRRGGTGQTANWARARQLAAERPILLAGGLTAANVADAIRAVRPWGVDVSSGVERRPGVKDPVAIQAVMAAVRAADRALEMTS